MARKCPVCKKAPIEGTEMRPMRLSKEDITDDPSLADDFEDGLYAACVECVEEHRKRVSKRMNLDESEVTNGMLC